MSVHDSDKNELLAMLEWQLEMGADEAIVDNRNFSEESSFVSENCDEQYGVDTAPVKTPNSTFRIVKETKKILGEKNLFVPNPSLSPHQNAIDCSEKMSWIKTLTDLRKNLDIFDGCELKKTASNLCFSDGNPGAQLMIIGEAPSRDEDRMGVPFVGPSGDLLDRILASFSLDRSSVYLTTLLPWRPPGNRTPTEEEISILLPWLYRHIQILSPKCILVLGGMAAKLIFCQNDSILKLRGVWRETNFGNGVCLPVIASLHPSYLIRVPAQKQLAFEDFMDVATKLKLLGL